MVEQFLSPPLGIKGLNDLNGPSAWGGERAKLLLPVSPSRNGVVLGAVLDDFPFLNT